jgi:hypothetical protein
MATLTDIAQIILLMQTAFPNYHPEQATPDVLYQFLEDLPSDNLKAAVFATCAQNGRVFAPSVGEIREAALKQTMRAMGLPNEFEAWKEVCRMPKDKMQRRIEVDDNGKMVTNENGAVIIHVELLKWSHPLVEKAALLMGWPNFPGEDESLDRAHFFQAYRAEINRMMETAGELPVVREFVESLRRNERLTFGQELKKLEERITHE